MGFEVEPTHYKLTFEPGHKLHGLHVTVGGLSIGEFQELTGLSETVKVDDDGKPVDDGEALRALDKMIAMFGESLISWDATRKRKPVPATLAGVKTLELGFVFQLIMAWISAISDVDIPLPSASASGATSAEEQLGLASSSASLPS